MLFAGCFGKNSTTPVPTPEPTEAPTEVPTPTATPEITEEPTAEPTAEPTTEPTSTSEQIHSSMQGDVNAKVLPSIGEMIDLILSHYEESGVFTSNRNYVIFEDEVVETEKNRTFIVRYQVSDEEAQEYLDQGLFPPANLYVTSIVVNMATGEVSDAYSLCQEWNMW